MAVVLVCTKRHRPAGLNSRTVLCPGTEEPAGWRLVRAARVSSDVSAVPLPTGRTLPGMRVLTFQRSLCFFVVSWQTPQLV